MLVLLSEILVMYYNLQTYYIYTYCDIPFLVKLKLA